MSNIGLGSHQEIVHPEYFNADIDKQNKIREALIDADLDGVTEEDEQARCLISKAIEDGYCPCVLTKKGYELRQIPEDGDERLKLAQVREVAKFLQEGI